MRISEMILSEIFKKALRLRQHISCDIAPYLLAYLAKLL